MGTSYTVKAYLKPLVKRKALQSAMTERLNTINAQLSTYEPTSEISRFNASSSTQAFKVSDDFYNVFMYSHSIWDKTNGVWDPTLTPIIELWGFYTKKARESAPNLREINQAMEVVGFQHLSSPSPHHIQKKIPTVQLDFSSNAKGYGVDKLAELLDERGSKSYMVEIGGEVRARGKKHTDEPWVIGINHPRPESSDSLIETVPLINRAMATSGDYENYYYLGNKRVSHILNAKTGMPSETPVVAVSVIADTAMEADTLATTCMALSLVEIEKLIKHFQAVEVIVHYYDEASGELRTQRILSD